ncbi:hypothetical protein PHPALM_29337 [Phytophthora palmivora]|uniref:SGNH hydrolase-type esterase domain-containing protein n=1 Tax=Phytophthora palmivora TaxID=4796 RepID=A0A2P4X7T9_9STRA|nr:hypothetical protein PHPALM_29337 [Phytophthora palmivora]
MPALEQEITRGAYSSPSLITIWLGTNDAVLVNGSNAERHVTVESYKKNLNHIVLGFQKAAPKAHILMITPPHIDDDARAKYASQRTDSKRGMVDRSNAVTGTYARACVEVANTLQVPVLDMYGHFNAMPSATRNGMLGDGIHFNEAGNKMVDEQFRTKISSEFPDLAGSIDKSQFPAASKYVIEDPWTPGNGPISTN